MSILILVSFFRLYDWIGSGTAGKGNMDLKLNVISLIGVYVLCILAWLTSENKKLIPWETIKWG
ncbi:MAG TPA: Na+ dependent nucleoside transporter N-terminal domain-containing protein, partial [Leptospiraceae bacterium]|nr:Na+ dependent nucleoside transporter N-terminal domain-containing protein [Leptospiraceae bacterium]